MSSLIINRNYCGAFVRVHYARARVLCRRTEETARVNNIIDDGISKPQVDRWEKLTAPRYNN